MRFDPQANFVEANSANARLMTAGTSSPLPVGMSSHSPLKTAFVIIVVGFLAGIGIWIWSEGVPGQGKAVAETRSDATVGAAVVQYAEAVMSGKTGSEKLEAVTGSVVDPEDGRRLKRSNRGSTVRREFETGKNYLAMGQHERAIQHLKKAVALDPGFAEAHYRLGLAYVRSGDDNAARLEWRTLRRLDPDLANLLAHLVDD